MKKKIFLMSILFLVSIVSVGLSADEVLQMKPGQEQFRDVKSIKRISVANPDVVNSKVLSGGKQIMIRAVNPGDTTVTIWDDNDKKKVFKIVVISTLGAVGQKIRNMISEVETVDVRVIDNQIVIEGKILREQDKKAIERVQELFKDIKVLAENDIKDNQKYVVGGLETELPPTVTAKLLGDGIMLEGKVETLEEKKRVERIAREYVENIYSVIEVQELPTVVSVNPVEFILDDNVQTSNDKDWQVFTEGLDIEKGIFAFVIDDDIAADNLTQNIFNDLSGTAAFEGSKDYSQNGQFELNLDNGEQIFIYFQFDVLRKDIFKVSVSLLNKQKKVLFRKDFFSKKFETLAIAGFYNVLRQRKKMQGNKELIVVFSLKN
ncbi:MAG: pilus assembly protein N-terminal domain-containing protein [Candidatus Aureabacteria bacterium]|nr:pilus assembly protein N-terminal domain-containing protein [Candidatus Auribacterota bacterium]